METDENQVDVSVEESTLSQGDESDTVLEDETAFSDLTLDTESFDGVETDENQVDISVEESALSQNDEYDPVLEDETAFSDISDLTLDTESFDGTVSLEQDDFTGILAGFFSILQLS